MAEVLGVAASVAGLISLADIVVGRGYKFLKAIKNAEKTVKSLVHEVNVLSGVLHSLSNTIQLLEEDENSADFDPTTQVHYIEACYQTLSQIHRSFEAALPSTLSTGQKIRWPLKQSETKELLADVQRHKSTMILAMNATEMSTLLKVLARQDSIQNGIYGLKSNFEADRTDRINNTIGEERIRMLNFLSKVEARTWQDSNIRLRQPGTGIWFTDGPEFKTWRSEANTKLWINGIHWYSTTFTPLIGLHKLTPGIALAFFYCDYKDTATHNPLAILGSLARQLIVQNEECFEHLTTFYQDHVTQDRQIRTSTPEELCDLIAKVSAHFQNTMIVVDGLDEISENRADITRFLGGLNDPSRSIKTLFASRLEVDIGHVLEDFPKISIAAMSSDLRLYVGSEIERRTKQRKLNIKDRDLKEHIMKTLIEGAEGMFRWVACQMDYLCECSTDRDRRDALKQLPPDLPSSYERILERVNRSNKQNQRLVRNALHWIVYAEVPLTTTEVLQALAVQSGDTVFDSSGMTTEEELLHWCSSLVRRNQSATGLELAHFTVKEFLLSIDPILKPQYIDYRLSGDHSLLAEACVTFLSCTSFDGQPVSFLDPISLFPTECYLEEVWKPFKDKFGFFCYAAVYWITHLRQCKSSSIHETVNQLFIPERSPTFRLWTHAWFEEQGAFVLSEGNSGPTPLHWAACFALNDVCVTLIELGMDVEEESKFGRPLNCALKLTQAGDSSLDFCDVLSAERGQKETIQVLLNAGANARAESDLNEERRSTAFQLALQADMWVEEPFAATKIMLDSGCTVLCEDFDLIISEAEEQLKDNGELYKSVGQLVETFASGFQIYLEPSIYLEFFSFALQLLALGCEEKYLSSLFNITFPDAFPLVVHQELNRLARLSRKEISLSQLLCQLIHTISENTETTKTILQNAITSARKHLDRDPHRDLADRDLAEEFEKSELWISELRVLQLCVEECWDLDSFRLFWNSTKASQYYTSSDNKFLLADTEKLLNLAVVSTDWEVAGFIVRKISDKGILSEAQWLELAIAKNSSIIWDGLRLAFQDREFSKSELDRQFALHVAARPYISTESYEFLLDKGADISLSDPNGNTPLHVLTQTHEDVSLEKMKLMLDAALNLNICNRQNLTPLALTIRCKNTPATQLLLEAGANPDIVLAHNQTALYLACSVGNTEAAKLLLEKGCNPSHQDSYGQTPKDIALRCLQTTLAHMIQTAIDERARVSSENTHNVGTWSTPIEDLHGKLPFRIAESLELPSIAISSSGSSAKRSSSDMDLESSDIVIGKKLRAA
ncbi:putative ankyrin repeat protein L93 [Lachnellula cervina]|uniref:Putative ankyrin repeat protein L93 n=1 Tax=Lachnellula cervina TaxID=1316786 RepID=A0A7D8UPE5_9HELO|nr:putative ankyrin repeat protein L93 [Lachnellula cervina]